LHRRGFSGTKKFSRGFINLVKGYESLSRPWCCRNGGLLRDSALLMMPFCRHLVVCCFPMMVTFMQITLQTVYLAAREVIKTKNRMEVMPQYTSIYPCSGQKMPDP
jgi:hypothetical protein